MSIVKDIWVKCDKCGEGAFPSRTLKQTRIEANQNGWVRIGSKDFCPKCIPEKKICTCGRKYDPVGWNRHAKNCPAKITRSPKVKNA